ncbi:MAG: HAD hydrolase-like protein [Gammaproteobacteria bacterium]|nr:HAD hydrolase-like protein [Gammaproteobacteria bacterium]
MPAGEDAEVIVIADQAGFPFVETIDAVLSALFRRLDAGQSVHLVLCNPDLVYPFSPGRYGITAGSLAAMLEAVLRERYHDRGLDFVRLGKPYSPIFEEASRRAGTRDMVMFGDQLATDILGARRFGIDSALVLSGLAQESTADWPEDMTPNYVLESLAGIEE